MINNRSEIDTFQEYGASRKIKRKISDTFLADPTIAWDIHNVFLAKKKKYIDSKFHQRVYFLNSGFIKLYRYTSNGEYHLMKILGKGDLFGDFLLTNETYFKTMELQALTDTKFSIIDKENYIKLINRNPALCYKIYSYTLKINSEYVNQSIQLIHCSSEERIRKTLRKLGACYGEKSSKPGFNTCIPFHLSHRDIGSFSGTSRQLTSAIMSNLKNQGIIEYDREKIRITDLSKL